MVSFNTTRMFEGDIFEICVWQEKNADSTVQGKYI
jgi:hypothetical protein